MRKSHQILLLLVLVAIAGAVWGRQIVGWLTPTENLMRYPEGPRYYCESCGKHFDEAPGRLPPLKCPKCGKATAMRTAFGPGSGPPEFIQCKQCQAKIPTRLFQWPSAEKARWEKRLDQLGEGQFLTSSEISEMQQTKLVKTSATDWMKWEDFQKLTAAQLDAVRCSKCGNTNAAQFEYVVAPPGAASSRQR